MSRPFTHRTPTCRIAAALLLVAHCAFTAAASVEHDTKKPQLAFAARELEGAMSEAGRDDLQVTLRIQADASSPEAFQIRTAGPNRVEVIGADASGAMYGGLEIADRLRLKLPIQDQVGRPFIAKRGIKFNIPLDARTPSYDDTGDSAQNNIETMWDFEFWKAYLDDLALYRYNVLTFWSTHPFPSLIKLEKYPDVALNDVYRVSVPLQPNYKNKLQDIDQNGDGHLSVEHDAKVLKLVKTIEFKNGQFVTWRGTPEKPEVALWKSREQTEPGDHRLAITAGKRLIIYRETEGKPRIVVWMSPEPN